MQSEIVVPALAPCVCRPSILNRLGRHWLLLGATTLALLAAGFVWQWSWLVAIGVAPLLIGAAPCVAMCALGLCMHRIGNRAGSVVQAAPAAGLTSGSPSQQER